MRHQSHRAGYQPAAGCQPAPQRNGERGYALLVVFLMAAMIAMYLYMQLPRVAFESERDKEQSLIDAGEQYKRAIQLYVAAVKKYPQKIEDLENTNNKRYLRKRYIDPMTGKDEWRLVHVNAAGILTDSLVTKPPTADGKPADGALGTNSMTSSATPPAGTDSSTTTDVNAAVRRRPSDVVGQAYTGTATVDPNDPKTWAPITIAPVGTGANGLPPSGAVGFNGGLPGQAPAQGFPGQFPGQAQNGAPNGMPGVPGVPGVPGGVGAGGFPLPGQPGFNPTQNQFKIDGNGQLVPVTPTQTGAVISSQTGGVQNTPAPGGNAGPGGLSAPGMNPNGNNVPGSVQAAINCRLTNCDGGTTPPGMVTAGGMATGGLAGVASMHKGPSIKLYGGRQKYEEWEFVFSLNNQQQGAPNGPRNPLQGGQPAPGGAPLGSSTGTPTGPGTGNP
jgi:type II secretory pathway pseudopilin PulG